MTKTTLTNEQKAAIILKYKDKKYYYDGMTEDYEEYLATETDPDIKPMTFNQWFHWTKENTKFFCGSLWQNEKFRLLDKD